MIDVTPMQGRRVRGGVLAGLAITFLLISACLVMAGLFFAHTVKVREMHAGKDVQVETPFGSVHVRQNGDEHSESVGIPMYPGAKPRRSGDSASVDLSSVFGDKDLHLVAGRWETSDPIDKVQKFYEAKFPEMSVIQHTGEVEMHSVNRHGKRVIVLHDRGGSTEIALASFGEPKAN